MDEPCSVFVYGTLKRGQCREQLWPATPISICRAQAPGRLYGRPDYPAMTAGDGKVQGELWRFDPQTMPLVLTRLDEIAGANQPGQPDLYIRVVIEVADEIGRPIGDAYTYLYATPPEEDGFIPIGDSWPAED